MSPVVARLLQGTLAVLTVVALPACGDGASPASEGGAGGAAAKRSILLISMDTTRYDHLHCYGYPIAITPNIDALAARGMRFAEAYAPMPQTLPSHVSLLTGLWPRQHHTLENVYTVPDDVNTVAEKLDDQGYRTGAFIGALALHSLSHVNQGFQTWDQPDGRWLEDIMHPSQRPASEVVDAALKWADGLDGEQPFLMFTHFYDPHGPFEAPARCLREVPFGDVLSLVRQRRAQHEFDPVPDSVTDTALAQFWQGYAAEIHYTDEQIGRLLAGLDERGLLEDTVVVLVGDHGEGLYEHGVKGHGLEVWQELQRVPLIMALPDGRFAGRVVDGRVTLVDVLPSMLHAALGVEGVTDDPDTGRDLLRVLEEGRDVPAMPIFVERPHYSRERIREGRQYGEQVAVIDGDYKLLRMPDGSVELFDLRADEAEQHDVGAQHPEVRTRLAKLVRDWMETWKTPPPGEQSGELDPERRRSLIELGYIDAGDGDDAPPAEVPGRPAGDDEGDG